MSDCGCDDDDDDLPDPVEPIVEPNLPIFDTALPDVPCEPDDALTGSADGPVAWGQPWPNAPGCDDWAAPIRPDPQQPVTDPIEEGTRPDYQMNGFRSGAQTWSGPKDNCSPGKKGDPYTYNLPAGSFSSLISQTDADAQARLWLDANGPGLARKYGTCSDIVTNSMRVLEWAGTAGCIAGLVALAWGNLNGQFVTGCPPKPSSQPSMIEVSWDGVRGCKEPGTQFSALTWEGVSGCLSN
jgi:hypothetical protein